jgi:hypothetical protein
VALYANGIPETSWNPVFDALRALPRLKDVVFWGGLKNQGSCWRRKDNPKYKPKKWHLLPLKEGGEHVEHGTALRNA